MSPRFKELAIEAGYSKDFVEIGLPDNQLKFAELIVRECDKYVTERWDVCEPWMDPGDLLKHFGVQE